MYSSGLWPGSRELARKSKTGVNAALFLQDKEAQTFFLCPATTTII
jgi:hypothetical protein